MANRTARHNQAYAQAQAQAQAQVQPWVAAGACLGLCLLCAVATSACGKESLAPIEELEAPRQLGLKTFGVSFSGFCPAAERRFVDVFFVNRSMVMADGLVHADWDRDGLADKNDINADYGFSYKEARSGGRSYSDLAVFRGGLDVSQQAKLKECENPDQDTDFDDLSDCEENQIYKTDPQKFDTDADGLPDGLEERFGTNPLDAQDAGVDPDGDALSNAFEIRHNTPVGQTNSNVQDTHRIEQSIVHESAVAPNGESCLTLNATNIPLMTVSNGNLVEAFVVEALRDGTRALSVLKVVVPAAAPDKSVHKRTFAQGVQK